MVQRPRAHDVFATEAHIPRLDPEGPGHVAASDGRRAALVPEVEHGLAGAGAEVRPLSARPGKVLHAADPATQRLGGELQLVDRLFNRHFTHVWVREGVASDLVPAGKHAVDILPSENVHGRVAKSRLGETPNHLPIGLAHDGRADKEAAGDAQFIHHARGAEGGLQTVIEAHARVRAVDLARIDQFDSL